MARRRRRGERGASAIELAILAPALLIVTMLIIQFALWFQAREAALAAAQEGARYAREDSFLDRGCPRTPAVSQALRYYQGLGTRVLVNPRPVCATGTGPNGVPLVGITITGTVAGPLNMFGGIPIRVTVEGPEECFHPLAAAGAC